MNRIVNVSHAPQVVCNSVNSTTITFSHKVSHGSGKVPFVTKIVLDLLLAVVILMYALTSHAALNGLTPFEIDASLCDFDTTAPANCLDAQHGSTAAGFDWEDPYPAGTTIDNLGRTIKYTGIQNTVVRVDDGGNGGCTNWYHDSGSPASDLNAYSGGASASENPWDTPVIASPSNKTDFCIYYSATEVIEIPDPVLGAQFHNILYQGFAVNLDGSGTVQTLIPLFTDLFNVRSVGDTALILDVDPSNLANSEITVGEWNGSSWVGTTLAPGSDQLDCSISSDGRMFVECAIDLTATGSIPEDQCTTVTLSGALSLTGGSFTSQLKDFVSVPANPDGSFAAISNCGQLKVTKSVDQNLVETFNYSIQHLDDAVVYGSNLADVDGDGTVDADLSAADQTTLSETLTAPAPDSMDEWSGVINSPDYTLSEPAPLPDDWELVNMECTFYDPFLPGFTTEQLTIGDPLYTGSQFTVWPDDITINPDGSINVIEDHSASCIINNTFVGEDFGDAPDTYGTFDASNGACHLATGSIYIGSTPPDTDVDGVPNVDANGDDTDADGDDEDGPLFTTQYIVEGGMVCTGVNGTYTTVANEYCVVVSATNNSAVDAQLVGWLDYNVDGIFDVNERSVALTDVAVDDGTFATGNIPANSGTNDYVLVFTGLGNDNHNTQSSPFQSAGETYARIRITSDPLSGFFSDTSPQPTGCVNDGEIEDEKIAFDILPVTLSSVSSELINGKVEMRWSTTSELFNVGFQLWGLDGDDQKWEKLHGWLVRSGSGNAVEPQSYLKTVRIPTSIDHLVALGISSVDSDGSEHYYGPFDLGQSYGNLSSLKPIAWNHIRDQVDSQMAARGYIRDRVYGYRKGPDPVISNTADTLVESVIEFKVSEPGMYRITAQDLLDAGIDWQSMARRDIALIDHRGDAVVSYVAARGTGTGWRRTLGAGGEIYFYNPGVDNTTGLYSDARVFRLVEDRFRALKGQYQGKQGVSSGFSGHYMEHVHIENDEQYVLTSAADDPWLDAVVLGYSDQARSYAMGLPVEADALLSQPSTLSLGLARSSALPAVDLNADGDPDAEHIVTGVVLSASGVNGLLSLGTQQATGSGQWTIDFEIPGNTPLTLIDEKAVVGGLFSAGDGYAFSEVHVDSISLAYARPYVAKDGDDYLTFSAPNDNEAGYEVTVPNTGWPMVFAYNDHGALVRLAMESQSLQDSASAGKQRVVQFAKLNGTESSPIPTKYWVSGNRGFLNVEGLTQKSILTKASLLTQVNGADYLFIAHPIFMGAVLSDYAKFKQSQGYTTAIVNYLDVVEVFGGGQAGPIGLTNYLSQVSAQGTLDHVLLVGSSVYDHLDKQKTGAMTFIPGHYGHSDYSNFTVSDVPYITAADGSLFATIGRWPVRTLEDLNTIASKSKAWGNADRSTAEALLIAEHTVVGENIDFGAAMDTISQTLPGNVTSTKLYVDQILVDNPGYGLPQALTQAKTDIINELNNTPDVVLYNGHGTTSQLSNKGLFKSSDITRITASGAEMWLPMSCYVTYYESTHINTFAHQLLFAGNAVSIAGSTLLSSQSSNIATGTSILDSTVNNGISIGEAVNVHKNNQNSSNMKINLSVLGDPSHRF